MGRLGELWRRLLFLFGQRRFDQDLAEEMRFHLEMKARANREAGLDTQEARYAAQRKFGNGTLLQEASREMWGWTWAETLLQDLKYSARVLRKNPVFTAIAVLSLALGIGANTAIFSVIDAILLKPLPVAEPDRLVAIYHREVRQGRLSSVSYPDYKYYRDHNAVFSGIAAYLRIPVVLRVKEDAGQVSAELVSPDYFSVLGIQPVLGRGFAAGEGRTKGVDAVVVISHRLWQERLGADPGIIGKQLAVGTGQFTVIGVAPRDFKGVVLDWGKPPEVWIPATMYEEAVPAFRPFDVLNAWGMQSFLAVARLRPGATVQKAQAAMDLLATQTAAVRNRTGQNDFVYASNVLPVGKARFWPAYRGSVVRFLAVLAAVVGLVLLLACSNVANLLLARAANRQKEMAIRLSIGAGRARLTRQLLTEGVLLSLLGGAGGLLVAHGMTVFLGRFHNPFKIPLALDTSLDLRILGFTFAISLLTGLVFGILPARYANRLDLVTSLKTDVTARVHPGRCLNLRSCLVAVQVALSVVLLVGSGLFVRTLRNAIAADPTVNADQVLLTGLELRTQGYDERRATAFYPQLIERVEAIPGVRSAALVMIVPLGGWRGGTDILIHTPERGPEEQRIQTDYNIVSTMYFETVGIPVLRGRAFTSHDREGRPTVAVINEQMSRRYWPGDDPLGKTFDLTWQGTGAVEVVGVVRDGSFRTFRDPIKPCFYLSLLQRPNSDMNLEIRTAGDPMRIVPGLQRELREMDKNFLLSDVSTLAAHRDRALAQERLATWLLSGFGLIALVLAAAGIYGVMSFTVAQRTREVGIRMALGAPAGELIRSVLSQALLVTAIGLAAGVGAALSLTQFVSTLLYGVSATDPLTFVLIAAGLSVVVLAASLVPARRATRLNPTAALRYE